MGSIPSQATKIPHTTDQLSPGFATTEPIHSRALRPQLESLHNGMKIPRAAAKTQHSQMNKTTLMDLEVVILSKINQTRTNAV